MQFTSISITAFAAVGLLSTLASGSPVSPALSDGLTKRQSGTWTLSIFGGNDCNGPRVYTTTQTGSVACVSLSGNAATGNHVSFFDSGNGGGTLYQDANCKNPIHNVAAPESCYTTLVAVKSFAIIS